MQINEDSELKCAEFLYKKRFILGPKSCIYGNTNFIIQYDKNVKTSKYIFKCLNQKCHNKISIRTNSFF